MKECYHNKGKTASGEMVKTGIVAVSPDLERKGLKLGTKIEINNLGTFVVKDRTSRRMREAISTYTCLPTRRHYDLADRNILWFRMKKNQACWMVRKSMFVF